MNGPCGDAVRRALDEAGSAGRRVAVWWRDDDATAADPALDRLLALSDNAGIPVALAVIPARLEASLPARLAGATNSRVLVHGLAHANHAPRSAKPAEFGADRPLSLLAAEAGHALAFTRAAFPGQTLAVFVPPWNRVGPDLVNILKDQGYTGLSTFADGFTGAASASLAVVNTHVDPVDWRRTRGLADPNQLAETFARRVGRGSDEPIGLLTHHLAMNDQTWAWCENFLAEILRHPAIVVPALDGIFAPTLISRMAGPPRGSPA